MYFFFSKVTLHKLFGDVSYDQIPALPALRILGMLILFLKLRNGGALFDSAQPVLEELARRTRLACKLSIRQWNEQLSVLRAESPEPFSVSGKNGSRFPVIEGSVGAALLFGESEETIRKILYK